MTLHFIVIVFASLRKKEENYLNILCILFYDQQIKQIPVFILKTKFFTFFLQQQRIQSNLKKTNLCLSRKEKPKPKNQNRKENQFNL